MVPKEYEANLEYRDLIIQTPPEYRKLIWTCCARDCLFYINSFGWTYDPRRDPGVIPFITYDFQDEALEKINGAIGSHDLVFKKSRDMGASWMLLTAFEWQWHFKASRSFLLVSRNEDYVDKAGNPKSLFWKIDFLHKYQPGWLLPSFTRTKLRLTNNDNGSSIDGESTTGDVARGDRRTAIGLDEFAAFDVDAGYRALSSTRDATPCRIFNSTPQGSGNAFYDVAHDEDKEVLTLPWWFHPIKSKDLEQTADGKPTSPWYENECRRAVHPMEIAQELDIDFLGSDFQFFDGEILRKLRGETCRRPYCQGAFDYTRDLQQYEFIPRTNGPLHLWMHVDALNEVPRDRAYCIGADVSQGTGASSSILSVGDAKTGEKVGRYKTNRMDPKEFGRLAVALARYFNGAYLIWEANGPGRGFGDAVIEAGYRNIYFRRNEFSLSKKQQDTPGWYSTVENKMSLLTEYRRALATGEFVNRCREALDEASAYIYTTGNKVEHSRAHATVDLSDTGESHGDEVIADALCWKGMRRGERRLATPVKPPVGSFAWRTAEHKREKREKAQTAMSW